MWGTRKEITVGLGKREKLEGWDFWHGNPKIYSASKINPKSKKTCGHPYNETIERIEILKENGYKVIYIWESDFLEY